MNAKAEVTSLNSKIKQREEKNVVPCNVYDLYSLKPIEWSKAF